MKQLVAASPDVPTCGSEKSRNRDNRELERVAFYTKRPAFQRSK